MEDLDHGRFQPVHTDYRNVYAESLTRLTDFQDKKTGMLFGDGAGAAVIGPSDSGAGVGPIDLTADGGLGDTIVATFADGKIRMDGISTFKIAVKRLSESTARSNSFSASFGNPRCARY